MSVVTKESAVSFALLGLGETGRKILREIGSVRGGKLVAVADASGAALADLDAEEPWGDPVFIAEPERLCTMERIDALRIDVPMPVRFEYVKQALDHGKSVLVKAPLAGTLAEAEELHELARRNELVLATSFTLGRRPEFRRLCRCLRHGLIGRLLQIDIAMVRGDLKSDRECDRARQCRRQVARGGASIELGRHAFAAALRLVESVPGGDAAWEFESAELECGALDGLAQAAGDPGALVDESASGRFRCGGVGFTWRVSGLERRAEASMVIKLRGDGGELIADFNERVIRRCDREQSWSLNFPPVERRNPAVRELSEFCRAVLKRDLRRNGESLAVQAMLEQVQRRGTRRVSPPPA